MSEQAIYVSRLHKRSWLLLLLLLSVGTFCFTRISERSIPHWIELGPTRVRGVFHIHSDLSHDSVTPRETWAQMAAQAGLQFLILTEHNQQLPGPIKLQDVWMFSQAEISSLFGHVIQLGATGAPSADIRRNPKILEELREQSIQGIIAHPSHQRVWDGSFYRAAGLEMANFAASSRRQLAPAYLGVLSLAPVFVLRPELALLQLFDRDERALKRWDEVRKPDYVGFCAADAHGKYLAPELELQTWQIMLDEPRDKMTSEEILEDLKHGKFFCANGLLGEKPNFFFSGKRNDEIVAKQGNTILMNDVDELVIQSPQASVPVFTILFRNGEQVARTQRSVLRYSHPQPGNYRVEIRLALPRTILGERQVSVIYSNRISVIAP